MINAEVRANLSCKVEPRCGAREPAEPIMDVKMWNQETHHRAKVWSQRARIEPNIEPEPDFLINFIDSKSG
jgi:hypothetical protein